MSGDGPLSIERNATEDWQGPLHKLHYGTEYGWLTDDEADAAEAQLDRARRCAEAEANLLLCSLALSSMEDERDDARAERDAALAEVERLRGQFRALQQVVDSERAELAARPDLIELQDAMVDPTIQSWSARMERIAAAVDHLLATEEVTVLRLERKE